MCPEALVKPHKSGVGAHRISPSSLKRQRGYIQPLQPFNGDARSMPALKGQLLKWIGNKQKFADEIIGYLPKEFGTYYEPFVGSGAVLAHLAPKHAVASDSFKPLIEIWQQLHMDADQLIRWYEQRYALIVKVGKVAAYEKIKADYNTSPNGADLLFLSRTCYGGIVRFRKADGYMSTPCGVHQPMPPENFAQRARIWAERTRHATFVHADFEEVMGRAKRGDVCYLDPPYSDSQSIIYGAQSFSLPRLFSVIERCKCRGVRVALSLDGTKKSGDKKVKLPIPNGLFEREVFIQLGRSMLRRFQMDGQTLETEHVSDRLLLTW